MLLSTLKNGLLESKELDKIWNYFFDLMDQGDFIKKSQSITELTKKEMLVKALGTIQQHVFKESKMVFLAFLEIPNENFYHGNFSISGILMPCVFFYFSDLDMGAFTYSKEGSTEMFRFSLTKIMDPKTLTIH